TTPQYEIVALVGYSSEARKLQDLTSDLGLINSALRRLRPNGQTAIGEGLLSGSNVLETDAQARPLAAKTLILMTDGHHNTGIDPLRAVTTVYGRDQVVHTITFGEEANGSLMEQIAQMTGGQYFHANDNADLSRVFRQIALTLPIVLTE
ncbi:MAG: VWA domain-containing protein, partial [Planctomycetes bacterium]|nr:VWA domain-containing protein [Planctomycetota bacterium]